MRYWLVILYIISLPSFAVELPDIGNSFGTVLSSVEEEQLGANFMRQLRQQVTVIDDIEINEYVNGLGQKLAAYSSEARRFHFFVIDEPSVNAFAVPGGFIVLHSGLILKTQTESELASVMAHEIAHVTQHHTVRTEESMGKFSMPMLAAALAAILLGKNNPDVAQAAMATLTAGNYQLQINFTREHEKEADRIGMQTLYDAGFDPYDMSHFFGKLQSVSRYYDEIPEFLRTHPMSTDRAAEALARAEQYPKVNTLNKDTPYYHLMRAKILFIISKEPHSLVQKLQTMLKEKRFRDERATRYALALALLADKQIDLVQPEIDWLTQHDGDRVMYRSLTAQLAKSQRHDQEAMQRYAQALQLYPGSQKLSLEYAELLVQNQQAEKAKELLLTLSSNNNPTYYFLLARTYKALNELPESYLTMAEYYNINGQTSQALEQIKQARQLENLSFYMATRIEARYKELQSQLREEKKVNS